MLDFIMSYPSWARWFAAIDITAFVMLLVFVPRTKRKEIAVTLKDGGKLRSSPKWSTDSY